MGEHSVWIVMQVSRCMQAGSQIDTHLARLTQRLNLHGMASLWDSNACMIAVHNLATLDGGG